MDNKASSTIIEFCARYDMSRTSFYAMKRAGKAPRIMDLGPQMRRISNAAEADWVREREAATASKEIAGTASSADAMASA